MVLSGLGGLTQGPLEVPAEVRAVTRGGGHISAGGLEGELQPWAGCPAAGPGCAQEPTGGPVKVQALTERAWPGPELCS